VKPDRVKFHADVPKTVHTLARHMLLRLSRLSFWLAAAAAALGLLAPRGHETLLTVIAGIGSALALVLWRSAVRSQGRGGAVVPRPVAEPELLDSSALADAAQRLSREAHDAPSFEAALHAAGKVLRGEVGARELTVHEVHGVDATQAKISVLIEAQPGFRTVERSIRLDATPLGRAIRSQEALGETPGHLAVPVVSAGSVVAAIELNGIELAFDPTALKELLDTARLTLSRLAETAVVQQDGRGASRKTQFTIDPAQPGPGSPDHGDRIREPGSDDNPHRSLDQTGRMPAMLSKDPESFATAPADSAGVTAPVLDPVALRRLTDLDPTGANHLLERVLQAFQTSVARLRPQADAARLNGDRAALRLVAHTLKSSSASIGAMRLSQLCGQIEAVIRQDSGEDLVPYHDALNAALDEALSAIASLLKEQT
jgi:HPt (histidine-containing phosphotransfer) domain-containing protein